MTDDGTSPPEIETRVGLRELEGIAENLWEGDRRAVEAAGYPDTLTWAFHEAVAADAMYALLDGGGLLGLCFVRDQPDGRRSVAFAKTARLAARHRVAFARGIGALARELARLERRRGASGPAFIPDPGGRDRDWFLRFGFRAGPEGWLEMPDGGTEG